MSMLLGPPGGIRVSTASDPLVAMAKMRRHRPHVILLDIEMPRMDGLTFLKQIMATDPIPVVVCSGFAEPGTILAVRALAAGAVDVLPKPRVVASGVDRRTTDCSTWSARRRRRGSVRRALFARPHCPAGCRRGGKRVPERARPATDGHARSHRVTGDAIIAIGASTGGTEALKEILRAMPFDAPGIVIVQHMPAGFTAAFAEHLADICKMEVREAEHGDRVRARPRAAGEGRPPPAGPPPGFRPGGRARRRPSRSRHRPSVDVLFRSVAEAVGAGPSASS